MDDHDTLGRMIPQWRADIAGIDHNLETVRQLPFDMQRRVTQGSLRRMHEKKQHLLDQVAEAERLIFGGRHRTDAVLSPSSIPESSEPLAGSPGHVRAQFVGFLVAELKTLKPQMQVEDEDYARLSIEYSTYHVFRICAEHNDLRSKVKAIGGSRALIKLAHQLAARHFDVAESTVKHDWDHRNSVRDAKIKMPERRRLQSVKQRRPGSKR